jgi:hypothetical protein
VSDIFKRHQRVQVVRCKVRCYVGATGRIEKIDPADRTPYLVRFDVRVWDNASEQSEMWFNGKELEAR